MFCNLLLWYEQSSIFLIGRNKTMFAVQQKTGYLIFITLKEDFTRY